MLALSVREGGYVTIGDDIVVQVVKTGDVFRIAIDAPRSLQIARSANRPVPACIERVQQKDPPGYRLRKRIRTRKET